MGGGFMDTSQFDSPSENKKDSVSIYLIMMQCYNIIIIYWRFKLYLLYNTPNCMALYYYFLIFTWHYLQLCICIFQNVRKSQNLICVTVQQILTSPSDSLRIGRVDANLVRESKLLFTVIVMNNSVMNEKVFPTVEPEKLSCTVSPCDFLFLLFK